MKYVTLVNGYSQGKKAELTRYLEYDPAVPMNRAKFILKRSQTAQAAYGSWSVKLEFSASKVGKQGFSKLLDLASDATPYINLHAMLPDLRVSRVDVAVDLIGIRPLDLILRIPKPGKRHMYFGKDGQPETIYLHEVKALPKKPVEAIAKTDTLGTLRLTAYERRAWHLQHGLKPPYGACPHTRVEVVNRWKQKAQRPFLKDLLTPKKNLMAGRIAGYAAGPGGPQTDEWLQFCLGVFGAGPGATHLWSGFAVARYLKQYRTFPGDLVNDTMWDRWAEGVAFTGLDQWIELAKKG